MKYNYNYKERDKMKKVNIDENLCIGCGACVSIDGEHFDFNDKGLAHCISDNNLESPALASASDSCPTGAIKVAEGSEETVVEEETGGCSGFCEGCECN